MVIRLDRPARAEAFALDEVFQLECFERVRDILKAQKNHFGSESCKDTCTGIGCVGDVRIHNAIFVDGDRGTGKTAFLLSVEKYNNEQDKQEQKEKLESHYHFLSPIDPTLVDHDGSFIGVVVAEIVQRLTVKLKEKANSQKSVEHEKFYKMLEKVATSLEAVQNKGKESGLSGIAQNRRGLELEQNLHEFFAETAKLFDKKVLVLPIDDVDMSFEKAHDVLESVRRYMASPYIIPIVSGDTKLYTKILGKRFFTPLSDSIFFDYEVKSKNDYRSHEEMDQLEQKNFSDNENKRREYHRGIVSRDLAIDIVDETNTLTNQYLAKIFPTDQRIELKPIFDILKTDQTCKLLIPVKKEDTDKQELEIDWNEFRKIETACVNLGVVREEFMIDPFENNARLLTQYLHGKKDTIEKFCELKDPSIKANEIESEFAPYLGLVKNIFLSSPTDIKKALAQTSEFYWYSKNQKKLRLSRELHNDCEAIVDKMINTYKIFKGDFFHGAEADKYCKIEKEYLGGIQGSLLYIPRQKVEAINNELKTYTSELDIPPAFAYHIFVHDNYYASADARKKVVLTGRFIELMFASFEIEYTKKSLEHLLASNFFNGPKNKYRDTKSFFSSTDDDEQISEESEVPDDDDFQNIYIKVAGEINKFAKKVENKFIATHMMHEILDKFYINLNILKETHYKDIQAEPVSSYLKRVVYIFINSLASFENGNIRLADTNIAIAKKFNKTVLENKDLAYRRNIKPLLALEGSLTGLFVNEHPIIKLILNIQENDALDISFVRSSDTSAKKQIISQNKHTKTPTDELVKLSDSLRIALQRGGDGKNALQAVKKFVEINYKNNKKQAYNTLNRKPWKDYIELEGTLNNPVVIDFIAFRDTLLNSQV